jgi:hypothetical protein
VQSWPGWHQEEQRIERILPNAPDCPSTGLGGITSAITRLLSARHCFVAAFSWRHLSSANVGVVDAVASCAQAAASLSSTNIVAGNAKSDDAAACSAATIKAANTAAHSANKEQYCFLASTVSAKVTLRSAASQQ